MCDVGSQEYTLSVLGCCSESNQFYSSSENGMVKSNRVWREKNQGVLREVVRVDLSPSRGGKTLLLESYVVSEITSITYVHVQLVKNISSHLADIWLSDENRAGDVMHVDLLIGADYLWHFTHCCTELGSVFPGPLKA